MCSLPLSHACSVARGSKRARAPNPAFYLLLLLLPHRPRRCCYQLVVASPPRAKSEAEALGVKKGDLVLSINGLKVVEMDSFEVTDYLATYEVNTRIFCDFC